MEEESASWPLFYPNLQIQVYAPRFYHKSGSRGFGDEYSRMIVQGKHEDLSDYFFTEFEAVFLKLPFKPDLLVVVPSSNIDRYSPTMLTLGKKLAEKHNIKNSNIIIRIKEEKRHTDCADYNERHQVTDGSFRVTHPLKGETLVLMDDTRATGMTLLECAKELKNVGASKIVALCLGINQNRRW